MFNRFASIEQFRNIVKAVQHTARYKNTDENGMVHFDMSAELPKIDFYATTKIHGTNAAIGVNIRTTEYFTQSRNNIITPENDNLGFSAWANREDVKDHFYNEFSYILSMLEPGFVNPISTLIVYGEWAGKGIQKGVAVSEVEKFFAPFSLKVTFENGQEKEFNIETEFLNSELRIFPVYMFGCEKITIDFEHPELAQNTLVEKCLEVENNCPAGKYFGVDGIGEGIVLTASHNNKIMRFKVKGEKHSVSKVKTLAAVDVEKINAVSDFVEYAVTDNRLKQGLEYLAEQKLENDVKNIGVFIKWLVSDVRKEEQDTISQNGLDEKILNKQLTVVAKKWFLSQI